MRANDKITRNESQNRVPPGCFQVCGNSPAGGLVSSGDNVPLETLTGHNLLFGLFALLLLLLQAWFEDLQISNVDHTALPLRWQSSPSVGMWIGMENLASANPNLIKMFTPNPKIV